MNARKRKRLRALITILWYFTDDLCDDGGDLYKTLYTAFIQH